MRRLPESKAHLRRGSLTSRREPDAKSADLVTHSLDIENLGDQIAV